MTGAGRNIKAFNLIIFLLAQLATASIAWGPSPVLADGLTSLFAKEKNIRYVVELIVLDQRLTIDRTVHCNPYFFGELSSPFDVYYRPDRSALTQRLADGSGIIVIIPNYCYYASSIPKDYIPPIALVDDVEHPKRMDVYVSGVRLKSSDNSVQLLQFSAEITKSANPSGQDDEFAAWRILGPTAPVVADGERFRALVGFSIGLDRDEAETAASLIGSRKASDVSTDNAVLNEWNARHPHFSLSDLLQGVFHPAPFDLSTSPRSDPGYFIVPFVADQSGRLYPDIKARGTITFYWYQRNDMQPWTPAVAVEHRAFVVSPRAGTALFLPRRNVVMALTQLYEAWTRAAGAQ